MSNEKFVSPLMSRVNSDETLNLETLKKYVPLVNEGAAARETLANDNHLSREEKLSLTRKVREGDLALEKLIIICLPLIKTLAYKELNRRKAWNSRATIDDLVSEGVSGLLKGLRVYNVEGKQKSPTNYLGQWITTEIRRNTESLDHDFTIPYETVERQRKIRAIRSRLKGELEREPTDEEIIAASKDKRHVNRMMGRLQKVENAPTAIRRALTPKHIEEERVASQKTGAMLSYAIRGDEEDYEITETTAVSNVTIRDSDAEKSTVEAVIEKQTKEALARLLEESFMKMGIGVVQEEVIRRKYGIRPFEDDESIRSISSEMGLSKDRVSKIINAFGKEMTTAGGVFHKTISEMPEDELESLGLLFVSKSLGGYIPDPDYKVDDILSVEIYLAVDTKRVLPYSSTFASSGTIAWFECPQHGVVSGVFESERQVPLTKSCPQCQRQIPRVFE